MMEKVYIAWFGATVILVLFGNFASGTMEDEMDGDLLMDNVLDTTSNPSNDGDWKDSGYHLENQNRNINVRFIENQEQIYEIQKNLPELLNEGFRIADQILRQENEAVKNYTRMGMKQYVPVHFHFRKPSKEAKKKSACRGRGLLETSKLIIKRYKLSNEEANDVLQRIAVPDTLLPRMKSKFCATESRMSQNIVCNPNYPYRKLDGTCNNLKHETWGSANTPFPRYTTPQYYDGDRPRGGGFLPSPRAISFAFKQIPDRSTSPIMTQMLKAWGQFLDHDIALTPEVSASTDSNSDGELDHLPCCDDGVDATITTTDCMPIDVSKDPFYSSHGRRCLRFVRSLPAYSTTLGLREQVNLVTSFVDASNVYGSSDVRAMSLRSKRNGKMKENSQGEDGTCVAPANCKYPFLPETNKGNPAEVFVAGDVRVNEQPGLTAMHTLFLRYHNLLAEKYQSLHPTTNDETVYQEVRRMVGAVMQQITYNEFVPLLIGRNAAKAYQLYSHKSGYMNNYLPWVNPSVKNGFAAAAYRFGHTLIGSDMKGDGSSAVPLERTFFDNEFIMSNPNMHPSKMLKGECSTPSGRCDIKLVGAITDKLFAEKPNYAHGLDLMALNIMRGRDHGLPSYNEFRKFCGKPIFNTIGEMKAHERMDQEAVTVLESMYNSPNEIDFFPGALSESPFGGFIGDTLACILTRQFYELKYGDRFWYESSKQPSPFTEGQLSMLRKVSLASVLCDASDIDEIQQFPMLSHYLEKKKNERRPCSFYFDKSLVNQMHHYW